MKAPLLEIPVDDAEGLDLALAHGADRIELCSALAYGGLTPSPGLMHLATKAARAARRPVMAMIRPRAGHFCCTRAELDQMEADISAVKSAGLNGAVFGVLDPDGGLDLPAMQHLCQAASGLAITLHRAFDLTPDWRRSLDQAADLGIERVLTSGQAPTAALGADRLARMIDHARGRLTILPGGGVTAASLAALAHLPLTEVHASCSIAKPQPEPLVTFGFAPPQLRRPDPDRIAELRGALAALTAPPKR